MTTRDALRMSKSLGGQDKIRLDMSEEESELRNGKCTERGESGKDGGRMLGNGREGGQVRNNVEGTLHSIEHTNNKDAAGNKRKASKNGSDSKW